MSKGTVIIAALWLAGCAAVATTGVQLHGLPSASNINAGLTEDLANTARILPTIKPHADPTGQELTDAAAASNLAAQGKATATANALEQARKEADAAAKKAEDDLTAEKEKTRKAIADGHNWFIRTMYALAVASLISGIFLFAGYKYTSFAWCEYFAIACLMLVGASIMLTVVVTVLTQVTPVIVLCAAGLFIVPTVGFLVIASIEIYQRGKALIAQHADSTGSKQPTVAFPDAVSKVISNVVSPVAADPVQPVSTAPMSVSGKAAATFQTATFLSSASQAGTLAGAM